MYTVNFARADQSFVNVCLPTLESHSKPVLCCSLQAQASTVGNVPPMFLSSTGARLILWIRPTFYAQMAHLTAVPTNNFLTWVLVLVLMMTFILDALAVTFPFLPFLAFLASFAKTVHPVDLRCSLSQRS